MANDKSNQVCGTCGYVNPPINTGYCERCKSLLEDAGPEAPSPQGGSAPPQQPTYVPPRKSMPPAFGRGLMVFVAALRNRRKTARTEVVAIISIALLVIFVFTLFISPLSPIHLSPSGSVTSTAKVSCPIPTNGIGVCLDDSENKQQENIGLSDGSYALDVGNERPGSIDKVNGSTAFRQKQWDAANSLWHQALAEDTNDAEAAIYLEDLRVLRSNHPYITVVIGAVLADFPIDFSSRDQLQGAYIAQHSYNDNAIHNDGGVLLRLLVAKSGNAIGHSEIVTQYILQAAKQDKTIAAVMGWTKTSSSFRVLPLLTAGHIPMLTTAATGDTLTTLGSPYFFRISHPNKVQATFLVSYIEKHYDIRRLVAIFDPTDPFSQNFVDDFQQRYNADGHTFAFAMKDYRTLESDADFARHVKLALGYNPDAVLFETSRSTDMGRFLNALPPSFAKMKIFADSSVYPIANANPGDYKNVGSLNFVSSAFPDEWDVLGYGAQKPAFFADYATAFDPKHQHTHYNTYGYSRPDAYAMLAYDGMGTLLEAIQRVLKTVGGDATQVSAEQVQQALKSITTNQAFQGVTGQIAFGPDGNPVHKELLMLSLSEEKNQPPGLHLVAHDGCFLVQDLPSCKSAV